jgi:hypothetical protein
MASASWRKPFCSRYSYELLDATVVSLDEMELEKSLYSVDKKEMGWKLS